jgi:plasmid maintenance system antidote protein VapI
LLHNEIIKGMRSITPSNAQEIGAALGTSAFISLNLEAPEDATRNPQELHSLYAV